MTTELLRFCQKNLLPPPSYGEIDHSLYLLIFCEVDNVRVSICSSEDDRDRRKITKTLMESAALSCLQRLISSRPSSILISPYKSPFDSEYKTYYVLDMESWPTDVPYTPDMTFVRSASRRSKLIPEHIQTHLTYVSPIDSVVMSVIVYCTRLLPMLRQTDLLQILGRDQLYQQFVESLYDPRVAIYE